MARYSFACCDVMTRSLGLLARRACVEEGRGTVGVDARLGHICFNNSRHVVDANMMFAKRKSNSLSPSEPRE